MDSMHPNLLNGPLMMDLVKHLTKIYVDIIHSSTSINYPKYSVNHKARNPNKSIQKKTKNHCAEKERKINTQSPNSRNKPKAFRTRLTPRSVPGAAGVHPSLGPQFISPVGQESTAARILLKTLTWSYTLSLVLCGDGTRCQGLTTGCYSVHQGLQRTKFLKLWRRWGRGGVLEAGVRAEDSCVMEDLRLCAQRPEIFGHRAQKK
ncbi:uncharacterized protein LOC132400481 [Hypanus sabinus]|uniref:uncharacterized protein LOC132400481 n=1 Tax=Hypanus sabinus TaxID=79690 RepID=UPI0028C4B660|nr:uncharacterized protein LOC132400481 [Hypanus sabinus]